MEVLETLMRLAVLLWLVLGDAMSWWVNSAAPGLVWAGFLSVLVGWRIWDWLDGISLYTENGAAWLGLIGGTLVVSALLPILVTVGILFGLLFVIVYCLRAITITIKRYILP